MHKVHRSFQLLACLCLSVALSTSLAAVASADGLRVDRIGARQGLNAGSNSAIEQDRFGYMWFATQNGLVRYDGFHSRIYKNNPSDLNSLTSKYLTSLFRDERGRLWVGTANGLCLYDEVHDRFLRYQPDATIAPDQTGPTILQIINDGSGNLWLATDKGLMHFFPDIGKFVLLRLHPEITASSTENIVTAIARDAGGTVWLGSLAGVYRLQPGAAALQLFRIDSAAHPDPDRNHIAALLVDDQQTLWIGTKAGVDTWKPGAQEPVRHTLNLGPGANRAWVGVIRQDNKGAVWMGTLKDGLLRWDRQTEQVSNYRHDPLDPHSLADNGVSAIFQDRTGSLWIGSPVNGIGKLEWRSRDFLHYAQGSKLGKKLSDDKIAALFNVAGNQLGVVTEDGVISYLNPETGDLVVVGGQRQAKEKLNLVVAATPGEKDRLWVAADGTIKLFNLATGRYQTDAPASGAPGPFTAYSLLQDSSRTLWALTGFGLYRLDAGSSSWQRYRHDAANEHSISSDNLVALLEDRQGRLWVATQAGLDRFDRATGQFHHVAGRPKFNDTVNQSSSGVLFEDASGHIWLGNESGLARMTLNGDQVSETTLFPTTDQVDGILEDRGMLWISTDNGMLSFDPHTGTLKHFISAEGDEDDAYFTGIALRGKDGNLYFGGPHGITAVAPDRKHNPPRPAPPVLITDFQLFNQSVPVAAPDRQFSLKSTIQTTKALSLSYLDSVFSIEFAALDYDSSNSSIYAYQLQGFDKNWVYTDAARRLATYTNLDPGHYVFRVKAANRDGVWNETGAQLDITITPPYWKTWWFRLLAAVLFIGSALAIYRIRVRSLLRQSAALEQQVRQRTEEIVRQKNVIEEKNTELEKINRLQEDHQNELTHFLAVASHDLRQPIHALNIYLGALTELDVPETARTVFRKMRRCVQIMDEMFLALLDLSRLEAHAVRPRIEHFSIATLFSRLEVEFTPQANAAGLTLSIDYSAEWIQSDANLVNQILANLIANAVRYTKTGSISVRCEKRDGWLRVVVQDTGIGISPSQQSMVFEKFHQLDNADREKAKGIGLGLAIVKRLCELLALPLGLTSTPGQGSVFTLDLPLSQRPTGTIPASTVSWHVAGQISLSTMLVVVIDDDESILDAMRVLLEKWGCVVTTASSGKQAITMLGTSSRTPDVIICDYRLHVAESGMETITMLQTEFNQEIPALLVTGDTSSDTIHELQSDSISVMHKPLRAEVLRDALVRLLYPEAVNFHDDTKPEPGSHE